ncbi:hypothetical protein A8709_13400 [Paenibacillus pectinilyticus]|uniref:Glycoside hydrolase family 127 protein n=1 Tax=Paenibacillus pectinilyticus TaxID=512399 RepID=A0A1C1A3G5_9BACL|nr:beta-L-arabinofuranosidase domain-containing protein [Paenibacillus pectinilyticus]OCT15101.1 hypothetical protein A8709_13400 [Paenibacillus pectinilyticus]
MREKTSLQSWQSTSFTQVSMEDHFWQPRLEVLKQVTLPACLHKCEETGRITNFAKAAGLQEGKHEGIYFNDSDVYKVLEGAAYSLMNHPDPVLEAEIDRIIDFIAAAQDEDGYLSTYYTLEAPESKWSDMEKHEMYCGGHLIEAAVAYYEATGKRKLLDTACKLADHYDSLFGVGKRHWVEGHQEIELALMKLYKVTAEPRYWKLALWLLEERGHGYGIGMIWDKEEWGPPYCQDDVPVKDIQKVTGHAVRAMYLYSAMADAVHVSSDPDYVEALHRVWNHTVDRNMYITGGIGPSQHNEGFTHDYDLPNETAYCETCAAIAMAFWNHRMNLLFGDAKYADLVEREMYNGALAGISLSGDKFFYVNPLASKGDHHRVPWYDTSCCPTSLVRFLPSIGQYMYATSGNGIVVNQFINSEGTLVMAEGLKVNLKQTTVYPWHGRIELSVNPDREANFTIRVRIPDWCRSYKLLIGGESVLDANRLIDRGYIVLERSWSPGDLIVLEMDMPAQAMRARSEVEANRGRIAIQRGPLVYCVEQADNPGLTYDTFTISDREPLQISHQPELLGGVTVLKGQATNGLPIVMIPYYAWDNREEGFMQIWIKEVRNQRLYS